MGGTVNGAPTYLCFVECKLAQYMGSGLGKKELENWRQKDRGM